MSRRRWLSLHHHLFLALVLVGLLAALVPVSTAEADSVVTIPDPWLRYWMLRALQRNIDEDELIYRSELLALDHLEAGGEGGGRIVNLSGIEHCTNLTYLGLIDNEIGDISLLSGLTNLTRLDLNKNPICDLSPLSGLSANLTQLSISHCQISDYEPLCSLTKLEWLNLCCSHISDISFLACHTNLTQLGLGWNEISDIEPLVDNPGFGAGDYISLVSNPLDRESIDIWIPALEARGVTVAWDRTTIITGCVEDGYGHKLGGVEVTLFDVSSGSQTMEKVTITDDDGKYSFHDIDADEYQIEIALECHKTAGDTATFSVNHDAGPSVRVQTAAFDAPVGTTVKNVSFADPELVPAAGIPRDRLDDLAGMYYHTKQVIDFESKELGFTPDLNLPIEVHGYVSDNPSTTDMDERTTAYYLDGQVYIGADRSDYNVRTKPWTPDWHEMFHELMGDKVGIPPQHTGDTGHGGYANHCTVDSWVEGWAEFWPCALARSLGVPEWYLFWGTTSLEQNWMAWDSEAGTSREEFAVASLLVDLVDPVNPPEYDFITMSNSDLWKIIGSKQLANMFEVYSALVAANAGQTDSDADGISDLDILFIEHGFFADDGNGSYDGEAVGLGGKPGRQSTMLIPNAYLRIIVEDSQGNPISNGTLLVDVVFDFPLDIYNYSYEVDLHESDGLVYFEVAPDRCDALIKMRVKDVSGTLSDELVVSNSVYWDKVGESTTGYAAEHSFEVGAEGETTELGVASAKSGGVPVWVWPIVGVAVVAVGAGGFFMLRRGAKTG